MSGLFLQFGGSALAIAALVGLAHWLGFSRTARLRDEEEARQLFALVPGGFRPVALALDEDRHGAIARDSNGALAVLVAHGGRFVGKRLDPGVHIEAAGNRLRIHTAPVIELRIGEAAQEWAKRQAAPM